MYCDWTNRDSLLITQSEFIQDLESNYQEMRRLGISKEDALNFLPPFEWYNDLISSWTRALHLQLFNYTPGTLSHADYTTPDMSNFKSSVVIYQNIIDFEKENPAGLNGFILLSHIGTAPQRTDKFYNHLDALITYLKGKGYQFKTISRLLRLR